MKKLFILFICFFITLEQNIFTAQSSSCPKGKAYYNQLLKAAASIGNIGRVEEALNCNADEIITALDIAAGNNNPHGIIEYILRKKGLSYTSNIPLSPLFYQKNQDSSLLGFRPKEGSLEYHRRLHVNPQKTHPLARVAIFEHKNNFLSYLLKHLNESEINSKNEHGSTLLTLAAEQKDLESVKELLKYNVELEALDGDNETALANAIRVEAYDIAELLLENGANPNNIFSRLFNKLNPRGNAFISQAKKQWLSREAIEKSHYAQAQEIQRGFSEALDQINKIYAKEQTIIKQQEKQKKILEQVAKDLTILPDKEAPYRTLLEEQQDFGRQTLLKEFQKGPKPKSAEVTPVKKTQSTTDSIPLTSSPSPLSPSSRQSPDQTDKEKIQEILRSRRPIKSTYNQLRDIVQKERAAIRIPVFINNLFGKFNNVSVDFDHIINISLNLQSIAQVDGEDIIIFGGGHTNEAVRKLINLGLLRINQHKQLRNGCEIFYVQNLINNTPFIKSTFPRDWPQEMLFEKLFITGKIVSQEQDPLNKAILIITAKTDDELICYKVLYDQIQKTVLTAYPIESC